MADVTRLPGVFEQMWLIGGLRWRILKNGLRRKHNFWDLIAMIWVAFLSGCIVIGVSGGFYAGGYAFVAKNDAQWFLLLFWLIFLWWQIFPLFVAGFGSTFEFSTLLRFPMSRRAFYLLGLGYGFSDFAAISSTCWIIAMVAGAATARWNIVPALIAASALFVLLNVTLERLIGSWVEKILAKRRSREIFLGVFILGMVSLNFLNPALHQMGPQTKQVLLQYLPYLSWFPGSLAGNSIGAALAADSRGALLGLAGLLAWLAGLSALLWQRFSTQYSGEEISDSAAPAVRSKRERKLELGAETIGWLAPQVTAVVVKEFRYLTRNGFAFISLLIPPIMLMFFMLQFGPGSPLKQHSLKPTTFFPAIIGYLLLILVSPAYNSFAYEGKGIQSYFMAPVRFRDVMLGKNLFLCALVGTELVLALSLLMLRLGWPGAPLFLSTVIGGTFAVVGQLAIANWSSLSFPKKMEIGKMKGQRNSGVAVWTAFGVQLLVGGVCAVVLLAGTWTGNPWLPPIAFIALTAAAVGGYVSSLGALDRLAESKKEQLIEALSK